jgi:YNFM family putative membrane transporter
MYSTQAILPVLGHAFAVPPATAGLTVSVVVLSVAIGSLIAGPLSDRLGRKPVMTAVSALLVLPTLLVALAPSFASLVVFRGLQGLLMPGLTSVAIAYVSEVFPSRLRGTAMGVYVSGQVLGGLLSRGISAAITDWAGWREALLCFAPLTAIGALLLAFYLPAGAGRKQGSYQPLWAGMRTQLRNRTLLPLCLIGFTLFFSFVGTFTYLPYYLTGSPFHLPTGSLGLVYLVWLGGVLSPVSGALTARLGREVVLTGSLILACLGMTLTLAHILPVVMVGLALQAIGQFTAIPAANLLVGEAAGEAKGSGSALYLCLYYLGGSAGALLPGLLWQHWAWPGVIAICLGLGGIALVSVARLAYSATSATPMAARRAAQVA